MSTFNDKIVLITGATRGIGEKCAQLFESEGAQLILTGTNPDDIKKLNKNYNTSNRKYFCLDLNSEASINEFISKIDKYRIDILVNNAGINILDKFIDVKEDDYLSMLQVNLKGAFKLSQFCAKKMIDLKYGRIINICSIWSKITRPKRSVYTITKNALHGMTQTMAVELGVDNILVNSVSPGFTLTELTKNTNTKEEIFIRENVYSNNQLIISMQAYDIIDLERIISQSSYWIKNNVNEKYNEKIIKHIYSKGLNIDLMSYINQVYDLKFDIQKDFIILNEDENNQFIWLGRGYPYRWISIFKIKYNKTYSFWNSLEEKVDEYMPSISISEYYRKKDETYIKDNNKINVYRGIYDHQESETGGPFFVYEIKKIKNDEIIFLTGFVNYPGHKKINLLKGIEVLFNTVEI